jgi:hypothetical protein
MMNTMKTMNPTMRLKMLVLLFGASAVLAACGDDPAPAPKDMSTSPEGDMTGTPDMDMTVEPDAEPDLCEPKTVCDAGTCGEQPDGCGGTLDCGVCVCENSLPVKETCGECGLGRTVCSSATQGRCDQIDWNGVVNLECKNIIYVAAGAPVDGAGTKEQPIGDVQAAIDKAFNLGEGSIVVIGGAETFKLTKPLEIINKIHVLGGFDLGTWTRSDARPELSFEGQSGANVMGIQAHNVTARTVVANLRITVAGNNHPGGNVYGVHAYNAGGLILDQVAVQTGFGGPGADGVDGMPGAPGGNGENGKVGRAPNEFCLGAGGCNPKGGINASCPAQANMPNRPLGGYGGEGLKGQDASPGGNSVDGLLGGNGGRNVNGLRNGLDGQDGTVIDTAAQSGDKGRAAGEVPAQERYFVHLGAGGDGQTGRRGESGGGGGGAVGVMTNGAYGGGGGAGGCGGGGGKGGQAGGSTFGLFIVDSQGVEVRSSTFQAGAGGKGGAGAVGAQGGVGGRGGSGFSYTDGGTTLTSGNGGRGARGQEGGDSGGGAGGFSFGAWCARSSVAPQGTVVFTKGVPGQGGQNPPGRSELKGETGRAEDQEDCLPAN